MVSCSLCRIIVDTLFTHFLYPVMVFLPKVKFPLSSLLLTRENFKNVRQKEHSPLFPEIFMVNSAKDPVSEDFVFLPFIVFYNLSVRATVFFDLQRDREADIKVTSKSYKQRGS